MPVQISPWDHRLLQVNRILGHETMTPIVKGLAKLGRPGFRLKHPPAQEEPEVRSAEGNRRGIRLSGNANFARFTVVGRLNLIFHPKTKIRDLVLGIITEISVKQNADSIRTTTTSAILQKKKKKS